MKPQTRFGLYWGILSLCALTVGCREDEYCNYENDDNRCIGDMLESCEGSYTTPSDRWQFEPLLDCAEYGLECIEWEDGDGLLDAGCKILGMTCEEYYGDQFDGKEIDCIDGYVSSCWSADQPLVVTAPSPYCSDSL